MELRAGYKHSELVVIPEDWETPTLGNVGEILIGLTYSPNDVRDFGTLVLRSSNIQNGRLTFDNNVYVEMELPPRVIVRENDLLICVRNGSKQLIGKCTLINETSAGFAFGAFMSVFRSPANKFILHQFKSEIIQRQIREIMGATINQITNRDLASFKLPLPPLPEQAAIATALSDMDALIAHTEKLIEKKKAIKQGVMQRLLSPYDQDGNLKEGWVKKRLGEYGKTYGGLTGKSKKDFGFGGGKYIPFMNIMSNPVIDVTYLETVDVKVGEVQNKAMNGDLFFNGSSETPEEVGMCSVLMKDVGNLYLNSFCFGFRLSDLEEVNGLFLAYYFRSHVGRELLFSLAQGATRYNLSKTNLLKLELGLPSKGEQDSIAHLLANMDEELDKISKILLKLQHQKQGMMQSLLTGRIRIYSPQHESTPTL